MDPRNVQLDALATLPNYRAHLVPIWESLFPLMRGRFATKEWELRGRSNPVMVASYADLVPVKDRPIFFVEHGSGQTYSTANSAYPGGRNRQSVKLFICPSDRVADLNAERYPDAHTAVVGCPPLDPYHRSPPKPEPGLVALAFHWDALGTPESRTAFKHYARILPHLAKEREVIGHAHPRIARTLRGFYERAGIRWASLDEVYRRASVMVVDNSSVGWEFMSLDRPVVWLNAPWYRREVEHGMRFWEFADSGVQVDGPGELPFAVSEALMDTTPQRRRRHEVIEQVYRFTDGHASERAADAIAALLGRTDVEHRTRHARR